MNNTTDSQSVEIKLNNLTNKIDFYYSVIVIPIGLFLNIVTILIFSRSNRVMQSSSNVHILYIGLSVYDILALLNSILFAQLLPSLGVYLVNFSQVSCIALNWYRKVVVQAPSWVQVLITFERYISVVYANRIRIFKRKLNIVLMLLSIFITLSIVNIGHAWYYVTIVETNNTISYSDNGGDESAHQIITNISTICTYSNTISLLTDFVNVFFRFLIPFGLMIVLNVLLSKNLYESKKKAASKNRSFKRERNYTITVIGLNVLFFVLNLPWAVYYALSHIQMIGVIIFDPHLDNAILGIMNAVVFSIFYLNNLSSFFLNLFFNRVFRRQFFFFAKGVFNVSSTHQSTHLTRNGITTNREATRY